jgi:hypothetical protein
MPIFQQAYTAIRKQFRDRKAGTSAEIPVGIDVLIAHIQAAPGIADCDKSTEANPAAVIRSPNSFPALIVVEPSVSAGIAVRSILARHKNSFVQIYGRNSGLGAWRFGFRIRLREGERDGGIAMRPPKFETIDRVSHTRDVTGGNPP